MSNKRSRTDSEVHVDEDEQHRFAELEASLADAERQLLYLRTLKLQKLREQPGGIATETLVQAYTDPLVHLELQSVYSRYNHMVMQVNEVKKEISTLTTFPDAKTLLQENKRLKTELAEKTSSYELLKVDHQDALRFIQELQQEILAAKTETKQMQAENEKLQTEVFTWQQQVQISATQQPNGAHGMDNTASAAGADGQGHEYVGSMDVADSGSDSPVLAVEDNE